MDGNSCIMSMRLGGPRIRGRYEAGRTALTTGLVQLTVHESHEQQGNMSIFEHTTR